PIGGGAEQDRAPVGGGGGDRRARRPGKRPRPGRYEPANGFAMDVQRYLADEPVQACPPSVRYRLGKFLRRNKVALGMAACISLVLTVLIGSAGWIMGDRAVRRNGGELRAQDAVQEARRLLENDKSAEALSYIIQAEAIVANSGGGEDIMRESGRLRQDLEMLERLDETRLAPKAFDRGSGDQVDYTEAFAKYGLDLDRLDPEEAAERIRNRPISRQLIAAIDDWAVIAKRRRLPAWQRLLAVARLADPDRWRNRL